METRDRILGCVGWGCPMEEEGARGEGEGGLQKQVGVANPKGEGVRKLGEGAGSLEKQWVGVEGRREVRGVTFQVEVGLGQKEGHS
jgi:hypothetical protein